MSVTIPNGDGRVNSRIENYTAFFEKDSANDNAEQKENRLKNYTDVVNGMCLSKLIYIGADSNDPIIQDITMVRPSCMSMVGPSLSISRGFTRAKDFYNQLV